MLNSYNPLFCFICLVAYIKLPKGEKCPNQRQEVTSAEECKLASEQLGLIWGGTRSFSGGFPACYYSPANVLFNSVPGNRNKAYSNRGAICKTGTLPTFSTIPLYARPNV